MLRSLLLFSLTGFITPFCLYSDPQCAPRIVRVLQISMLSWHLVMIKSIICPCRERGMGSSVLLSIILFEHGVGHYQIEVSA